MQTKVMDITLQQWCFTLLYALIIFIGLWTFRLILAALLKRYAKKTKNKLDDFIERLVNNTRPIFFVIVSIYLACSQLELENTAVVVIRTITIFAILFQIGLWISAWIDFILKHRLENSGASSHKVTTINILGLFAKIGIWILLCLLALDNIPGVEITTLIASLGVGGIAIGLAVQGILGDLFASLIVALDQPFAIGDTIKFDDKTGTVEQIGLKSIRLRTLEGEELIVAASDLINSRIHNFKDIKRRRAVLTLGVSYDTSPDKLKEIPGMIENIIQKHDQVTFDRCHLTALNAADIGFETVYHVDSGDFQYYLDTQQSVNLAILDGFAKENIDLPYPIQQVLLKNID